MMEEMVYVIKESENYVNNRAFTLTSIGWLFSSFTGIATGFMCYKNKKRAEEELVKLKDINRQYSLDKEFYIEYINLYIVKKGHNVVEKLHCKEKIYT